MRKYVFMPGNMDWPFPSTPREVRQAAQQREAEKAVAGLDRLLDALEERKDALLVPETGAIIIGSPSLLLS